MKPRPCFQVPQGHFQETEDAMFEFTVMFTMVLVRILLPVGLLLAIGEVSRRAGQPVVRGL